MTNETDKLTTGVTWIVVADASQAEIYSRQKRFSDLELVQQLSEPEARSNESEFASDTPGRSFDSRGEGRHTMEPDHTGKQHLRESFARRIASVLESARKANSFQHLVIIAAPALLGELRAQLSGAMQTHVTIEIDKHMTGQAPAAIAALIDENSE